MSVKTTPYGSWSSPITSKLVSEKSVTFQEVHVDSHPDYKDTVFWTELRYDEEGRYAVCSHTAGTKGFQLWTPRDYNARTRVHEYGGGASLVYNGTLYFSNFKDQNMYKQSSTSAVPSMVTQPNCGYRYADGYYSPKNGLIYCIREDHSLVEKGEAKEPVNTVVVINPNTGEQKILASGCDFYSCPRVSPDGTKIVWVQWNHPNMPWDTTTLWTADLNESGDRVVSGSEKESAGGVNNSIIQPSWTCDNELLYISDTTDWWNLYHVTESGEHVNLLPRDAECGGPQWFFADTPYMVDPRGNGDIVMVTGSEFGVYNLNTKKYRKIKTGYSSHTYLNVGQNGMAYCVAGSPTKFSCVIQVNIENGQVQVLRESKCTDIDEGNFSIAKEISWPTSEGDTSRGYFYAPKNVKYNAPAGTLPPLLVKIHGGPTAQASSTLSLNMQYFTSRGMAVLDVNYRGSTGYGKKYRHRLNGKWGVFDLADACAGAQYLADQGEVDKNMLCIDGGSAGGYTTLSCLTFRDTFKAGTSNYGICDLTALLVDTHKFESRYLDTIVGPYKTVADKKVYYDRSPIHFVDKLKCALALFQGAEDKIVPPDQAEKMHKAVKEKGLPTMYVLFKGEQHGFRKSENIETALDGEYYFFSRIFNYKAADNDCHIPIENLDKYMKKLSK
ncbi:Esterase lipase thioesterase active site [Mactra antiquata]